MKKILFFGILILSSLSISTLQAQSDSITLRQLNVSPDEVVGATNDINFTQDVPLSGNNSLNYLLGARVYENQTSRYFCEIEYLFGLDDFGIGINFTYLPKQWGGYGSLLTGIYGPWSSLGVAYRPITKPTEVDWHLYTGFTLADSYVGYDEYPPRGLGFEVGTRIARGARFHSTPFSWCSGSMSYIYMQGQSYFTLGISLLLNMGILL